MKGEIQMAEERTLLVGVDLCEDMSQITCFNTVTYEPESVCVNGNIEKYMIPTILFYRRDTAEWRFGEEAFAWNREQDGVLIKGLVSKASQTASVTVAGHEYQPWELLEYFLKGVLGLLKAEYPNNTIRRLVVTVKEKNILLIQNIYSAVQSLGISRLRTNVQSHEQCFVNYAMNQPKELHVNDVVLFDYDEKGLVYYQLSINRRTEPNTVLIKKRDFSETLSYEMLQEDPTRENIAYLFESIALNVLHRQIVSTIYVTGIGFEGNWCKDALKRLCVGRRVFAGQNLYAKGAGYAARDAVGEGKLKDYLYLGEETLPVNIYVPLFIDGREQMYPLVSAGTAWYNANNSVSFIPDQETEVQLKVEYVIGQQEEQHFISMDGLRNSNRTTRLELSLEFLDVHTCMVRINDRGFGELFPSSNRVWEKIIEIKGNRDTKET